MATAKMSCQLFADTKDGSFGITIEVCGLTRSEAENLGTILHDPVQKAILQVVEGRFTPETNVVSTRGRTQ